MKRKSNDKRLKFSAFSIILFIVLMLYTAALLGILYWAIEASLKSVREFQTSPIGFPEKIVNNYAEAIKLYKLPVPSTDGVRRVALFPQMLSSSMQYSIGCAFCNTFVTCITAYCCARYRYVLSKIVYAVVLIVMVVPIVGSLPSQIRVAQGLGIYDKMWGMWIQSASFTGLYFLVFFETFSSMPKSFFEAARIDGAGDLTLLWRIAFPLAINVFSTIMLLNFITFWNDYQTPLLFLKSMPVLSYGLYSISQTESYVPQIMAAATIILVPIVIIFVIANKRLMGNLTVGGVKG